MIIKNKVIIVVGGMVLVAAVVSGVFWYIQRNNSGIVEYKEPVLTQEQKRVYDDKISQIDEFLKQSDLPEGEVFGAYMSKGAQLYGLGRFKDAVENYKIAERIRPKDPAPKYSLFVTHREMQDNDSARQYIQQAIELVPQDPNTWRSYIEFVRDRFHVSDPELDAIYKQAVEATPRTPDIVVLYAQFKELKGDLAEARTLWEKAVELNPRDDLYKNELARVVRLLENQ